MTQPEITTAARRIARELNDRPAHTRLYFDTDGHVVHAVTGQNVNGWTDAQEGDYAHEFWSRPDSFGGRWNQRSVQDAIDAGPDAIDGDFVTDEDYA